MDLECRDDVETLLWRFYGQALDDAILAEPFAELRANGLAARIAKAMHRRLVGGDAAELDALVAA